MTTLRDYQQKNAVLFKTHFVRGFVTHISVGIYLQQENTLLIPFRMSTLVFLINVLHNLLIFWKIPVCTALQGDY